MQRIIYGLLVAVCIALRHIPAVRADATNTGPNLRPLHFAVIADLDKLTIGKKHWFQTVLKVGALQPHNINATAQAKFSVRWEREIPLKARFAHKNRGLELSDLVNWRGSLWSICDSTGILYELIPATANPNFTAVGTCNVDECPEPDFFSSDSVDLVPKLLITDDGGRSVLPAKNEWLAVVDGDLHIGGEAAIDHVWRVPFFPVFIAPPALGWPGHGREWTEGDIIMGRGGEWVKIVRSITVDKFPTLWVDPEECEEEEALVLSYHDWQRPYRAVRAALGASFPG